MVITDIIINYYLISLQSVERLKSSKPLVVVLICVVLR